MTRRRLTTVTALLTVAASLPTSSAAQPADPSEQRRLQLLGTMPRDAQRAPANQDFLVGFVRRSARLYLHRLDGLACQALFSLGDEGRFDAAVGSRGGSDRNRVYVEGAGAPRHEDEGPFVLPADTFRAYWPPEPGRNTAWHEVQHALLEMAGASVAPARYGASMDSAGDTDDHHPLIEGVGQRGAEAYLELLGFEEAVRRADREESASIAQGLDPGDYAVQRGIWSDAHQRFSAFVRAMKRVANVPPEDLAAYRAATGVFFSTVEEVAEWYRQGGLRRQERGEVLPVRPPPWVFFPDLLLMPVRVELADARGTPLDTASAVASAPSETKDDVFRQVLVVQVRARGSMSRWSANTQKNRAVAAPVTRGRLRVKVLEDDPLAGVSITSAAGPIEGIAAPGGPSTHLVDVELAQPGAQPLRLTFVRRKLSELREPTDLHVVLEYTDPGKDRLYDHATAQLAFALGPGASRDTGSDSAPRSPVAAVTPPPPPGQPARPPLGLQVEWSALPPGVTAFAGAMYGAQPPRLPGAGTLELVAGPSMHFLEGDWAKEGGLVLELYGRRSDKALATLDEYVASVRPKDPRAAADFERFRHASTTVSGLRAFESVAPGALKTNHHWYVELDPQQRLWAILLGDVKVRDENRAAMPPLLAHLEATVRALRFLVAAPAPLTVSRSDAPVPRAFTDAPFAPNEIAPRAPPPPREPSQRRRRPAPEATTTPQPPPPPPQPPPPGAGGNSLALHARVAGGQRGSGSSLILSSRGGPRWTACVVTIPGRRTLAFPGLVPGSSIELPLPRFRVDPAAAELRGEVDVRCAEGSGRAPARL